MYAVQGLAFAGVVVAIAVVYGVLYRRAVPRPIALPPRYLTRNPSDLPPALVGWLREPAMTPDKLAATLLDLVRRGVIEMDAPGSPAAAGRDARHADRRLRLLRDRLDRLHPFERDFVYELFEHIGGGTDEVWLAVVREWWAAYPATGGVAEEIVAVRIYQGLVARGLLDPGAARKKRRLTWFSGALVLGLFLGPLFGVWTFLFISLAAILVTWTQRVTGVTREGAKVAARYDSFGRYLADYGRFKDRTADAVVVWEEYLPLAIVLGVGDQAERELRIGPALFAFVNDSREEYPDEEQAVEYLNLRRGVDLSLPAVRFIHGTPPRMRFNGDVQPAAAVSGPFGRLTLTVRSRPALAFLAISPLIVGPAIPVIAAGLLLSWV